MVNPVPAGVDSDLVNFFKSICADPELVTSRSTNVKDVCGYDDNPGGWRLLATNIRQLPNVFNDHLTLTGSDMDGCSTIADIEAALRSTIATTST